MLRPFLIITFIFPIDFTTHLVGRSCKVEDVQDRIAVEELVIITLKCYSFYTSICRDRHPQMNSEKTFDFGNWLLFRKDPVYDFVYGENKCVSCLTLPVDQQHFVQIWCFLCVWAWLGRGAFAAPLFVLSCCLHLYRERVYIYVKGILSRPIKTLLDNHMTVFKFYYNIIVFVGVAFEMMQYVRKDRRKLRVFF